MKTTNRYAIKHTNRTNADEGYSFDRHLYPADTAEEIVRACTLLNPKFVWTLVPEDSTSGIGEFQPEKNGCLPPNSCFDLVELHLSPLDTSFPRKFGKRVKAAGGTYSECRGNADCRYVTIPVIHWELIDEIVRHESDRMAKVASNRVRVSMIARSIHLPKGYESHGDPAWLSVHTWMARHHESGEITPTKFLLCSVWAAIASCIFRGIWALKTHKSAPMVTVPPPTPITPLHRVMGAITKIDSAIAWYREANLHHTPMWSDLNAARLECQAAYDQLVTQKHIQPA